jgi:hypothetical protein
MGLQVTRNPRSEASQELPAQLDREFLRLGKGDQETGELSVASHEHELIPLDELRRTVSELPDTRDPHGHSNAISLCRRG